MELNQSKCGVLKVTRNVNSIQSHVNNPINNTNGQKDLGVLITSDLKWNVHVSTRCEKANKMLGSVRRSSTDILNPRIHTALYKKLIRSQLTYCSQIWSPVSHTNSRHRGNPATFNEVYLVFTVPDKRHI